GPPGARAPPPPPRATSAGAGGRAERAPGRRRLTPAAPAEAGEWRAVVVAARDYYEWVLRQSEDGSAFTFPPYCPERRIPLDRPQIRIGRRSVSQGTVPEIDLGQPPEDPGASHTHAVLLAKPDGTWTL